MPDEDVSKGSVVVETKATPMTELLKTQREAIISGGEEESAEGEPKGQEEKIESKGEPAAAEEEFEKQEVDWDKFIEDHPSLKGADVKDFEDLAKKYDSLVSAHTPLSQFNAELEKLGIKDPEARRGLLLKLQGKELEVPKTEAPKTFADERMSNISSYVDKLTTQNESGETVQLSPEQKQAEVNRIKQFADLIMPEGLPDHLKLAESLAQNAYDEVSFLQFQLDTILSDPQFKDKIVPRMMMKKITEEAKKNKYPYMGIYQETLAKGENPWKAMYEYYIRRTKSGEISEEEKKQIIAEYEAEQKKKLEAKTESGKGKPGVSGRTKTFEEMSLDEQRKEISKQ